jgi:hypothetical protein
MPGKETHTYCGMTLRDWFAGMAMQGILSDPALMYPANELAANAYSLADAMIQERSKT